MKKVPLIYIIGSGHCGSTLLDIILDSHSKIFGVGELESFNKEILCACGKKPNRCTFWSNILKKIDLENLKIRRKKIDFILNRDNFYIKKKSKRESLKDLTNWLKNNELIYREILEKSKAKIIVDSSKNPDRVELLAKNNNIELIVIHLVRDGKAVTWSYVKKYSKALPFMLRWFTFNIKVEILKKRNNFKCIFVRYEDLVRNLEKTIKKILYQVDLEYEPRMLRFRDFTHHEVGGNRMRLKGSKEIREDIDWKQKMPKRYKILFNLLFGWLNLVYRKRGFKISPSKFFLIGGHSVSKGNNTYKNLSIDRGFLEKQIRHLIKRKYTFLNFEKINKLQRLPKKSVIMFFDDGFKDIYTNAYPIFKKYNLPFVLFLTTDFINQNSLYLDWNEVRKMMGLAEIGSHGATHKDFIDLTDKELKKELLESGERIKKETEKRPIALSFPHGKYNQKVKNLVKKAGYKFAVTTKKGHADLKDRFELKKIVIYPTDDMMLFKLKLGIFYKIKNLLK